MAGTHGKTTTSALLSVIMRASVCFSTRVPSSKFSFCFLCQQTQFDITAVVGGRVRQFPGIPLNAISLHTEVATTRHQTCLTRVLNPLYR